MNPYSAIAYLGVLAGVSLSQTSVPVHALPLNSSHLAPAIAQAGKQPDLPLLARVIQRFLESDSYQTESVVQIDSVAGSTTVQSTATVKTLAQHPSKFRSEITFPNPDQKGSTITAIVVSNGKQVWFYRPDLKQYQVMSYQEFDGFDDSYWLGFTNMIYSEVPTDVRQAIAQNKTSSTQVVQAVGLELKDLNGAPQLVDNRSAYVYLYRDAREGFTFSAFVEPETAEIKRLQIAGKAEGQNITVSEQIVKRTANPTIAPNTFTFSPPAGAKKVKSLAIGPL